MDPKPTKCDAGTAGKSSVRRPSSLRHEWDRSGEIPDGVEAETVILLFDGEPPGQESGGASSEGG
jgi:hypothetical protein